MTTHPKTYKLMQAIEGYRMSGGREEHHARKEALENALDDMFEKHERLREAAQTVIDYLDSLDSTLEDRSNSIRLLAKALKEMK